MHKLLNIMLLLTLGFAAEVVTFDNNWAENPLFNVLSETPAGVEIVFSIHKLVIEETLIDGVLMKTYGMPGIFLPNDEGAPNLAGAGRYIAIPQGAHATVTILGSRTEVYHNIEVAPAPNIPLETDKSPLRYEKDMKIYGRDAFYPESPVKLSESTKIRGVDVVILGIRPFQYNPVTKELIIYKDLRVRVDFVGGNGHFGEDRLRSRFWEPVLQAHLLNYKSLPKIDFYNPTRTQARYGYEYVIIVPDDPVFEAWGDTIKAWRKLQGISTEVFTLTEVGGSSSTDIESFLNDAYINWDIPPVAFLLLSDYPSSGEIYGITSPLWNAYCVSDNIYADVDGNDLPDMHHARICAQGEADLNIMINKFLSYERNPYTDSDFYNEPLVACGWQDDRWFQLCAEVIRGFFINVLGKNPARQYNLGLPANPVPGGPWSTNSNTPMIVAYFGSAGLGYVPDTNPYSATWWDNGSAAGVNTAINSGAFVVQHRDHGLETGWGEPYYRNNHLDDLINDMFTFVFSINCLTGMYNWYNECFVEKFHRIEYGALGLNAASEVSYSFVNDTYVWGMYDGLWPEFMPDYPGTEMTGYNNLRPCMAMTYGKYFLQESNWPSNPNRKTLTYHLFHHHSDAFVTLYSEMPQELSVNHPSILVAGATSFSVSANNGSVIALTVNGDIIGVAEGTGSTVDITIPAQNPLDTMIVTVTKANYYRYVANVPVADPGMPSIPVVTRPLDFARLSGLQPTLSFYSTDPQSEDVHYRILWDTDPAFNNPDSSTIGPYASGFAVDFTFPFPLVDEETYWWKVKSVDLGGSGYWTSYTNKRSFTVSSLLPTHVCSWFQTTADQFDFNTFNGTILQGDSVILYPIAQTIVDTILDEQFETPGIPSGWTVIDGNGDFYQWNVGTTGDLSSYTPPDYETKYAYYSDNDAGNGVINYNEQLISPAIYVGNVGLDFEIIYGYGFRVWESGEVFDVRTRFFNGSWGDWNTIASYTSSGSGTVIIDLTSYLPADSVQFEWMYHDESATWHWGYACAVDNVVLRHTYTLSNNEGTMTGVPVLYHDLSTTYARSHWGDVVWRKASAGDSIGIQIEYYNGSTWQLMPDSDLPGNSTGFYTELDVDSIPIYHLDTLTYHALRLVSLFYRKVIEAPDDPALLDWELGNYTNYPGVAELDKENDGISSILKVHPTITRSELNIFFSSSNPEAEVSLEIYDAAGRLVKQFDNVPSYQSQYNRVIWDGTDDIGRKVSAGVYFVRFQAGDYKKVEKAVLLR